MKRTLSLIAVLILSLLMIIGCEPDSGADTPGEETAYRITLVPTAGATVESENPIDVKEGDSAEFTVKLDKTYVFRDAKAGGKNPWFMTYDLDGDVSNDEAIDEETAKGILETNRNHYTAMEYFPYILYK